MAFPRTCHFIFFTGHGTVILKKTSCENWGLVFAAIICMVLVSRTD
jgi:hypothetical protein